MGYTTRQREIARGFDRRHESPSESGTHDRIQRSNEPAVDEQSEQALPVDERYRRSVLEATKRQGVHDDFVCFAPRSANAPLTPRAYVPFSASGFLMVRETIGLSSLGRASLGEVQKSASALFRITKGVKRLSSDYVRNRSLLARQRRARTARGTPRVPRWAQKSTRKRSPAGASLPTRP